MSKKREIDELLTQVYNKHEGPMQEITFLNSIFAFINRRSNVLAQPGVTKQITNVLQKNIDAKKKELETQKQQEQAKEKKNADNVKESDTTKKVETEQKSTNTDVNNTTNDNSNNTTNTNNNDGNKDVEITDKSEKKSTENEKKETEKKPKDEDEADSGSPAPVGNGGKTDRYVWTQTLNEVEMKIKVPNDVFKRDLNISMEQEKIYVQLKKTKEVLLDGEPNGVLDAAESSWTLDQEHGSSFKTLTLVLAKKQRDLTWWNSAIKGDPEINSRKIQPENSKLSDLDDDTRVTVEKMMFDQQQKMMGKPTSKELEQQELLEKFKKMHPEFDFSQLNTGK